MILAWKLWNWNSDERLISSLVKDTPLWPVGAWQTSACRINKDCIAPNKEHSCGLYSYFHHGTFLLGQAAWDKESIFGIMEIGGRFFKHGGEGVRSEKGMINAIICVHRVKGCYCAKAANIYGIRLFTDLSLAKMYYQEHNDMPSTNSKLTNDQRLLRSLHSIAINEYKTSKLGESSQKGIKSAMTEVFPRDHVGNKLWWNSMLNFMGKLQSEELNLPKAVASLWTIAALPTCDKAVLRNENTPDILAALLVLGRLGQRDASFGLLFEYVRNQWRSGNFAWYASIG